MENPCKECLVRCICIDRHCPMLLKFIKKINGNNSIVAWLLDYEVRERVIELNNWVKKYKK